jgi:hypothetical protein
LQLWRLHVVARCQNYTFVCILVCQHSIFSAPALLTLCTCISDRTRLCLLLSSVFCVGSAASKLWRASAELWQPGRHTLNSIFVLNFGIIFLVKKWRQFFACFYFHCVDAVTFTR